MPSEVLRNPDPAAGVDDHRGEAIAAAAERCFARWGVARTRMADIAAEAGLARPVLYRHYADREALVVAVMVRHIHRRAAELHERVPRSGPAGPLILDALLTGIRGDGSWVHGSVLDDQVVHDTARLVAQSDAVFDAMSTYWRPYLDHAAERGELRRGVVIDQAVRWLTFLVFHFLTVPETVPPDAELADHLRVFVVAALVDDPA